MRTRAGKDLVERSAIDRIVVEHGVDLDAVEPVLCGAIHICPPFGVVGIDPDQATEPVTVTLYHIDRFSRRIALAYGCRRSGGCQHKVDAF